MDNSTSVRFITPRPSPIAGQTVFTYAGEMSGIPINLGTADHEPGSYTITAEVDVPLRAVARACLSPRAGPAGGSGLYLLKGKPVFDYNFVMLGQFRCEDPQALAPGKHTIVFDFTYDGPGQRPTG